MKNKVTNYLVIIFMLILGAGLSYALYVYISSNGIYPSGSDAMYHVYRGDMLYRSFKNGAGFPLYDRFWYNGIEPMRYMPPLSPLLFALCETMTKGAIFEAYIFYCIVIFLLGLFVFTAIGFAMERPVTGLVMGLLWFFLPNNIYTLFAEGNLMKALGYVFLPVLFYLIFEFLEKENPWTLGVFCISFILLIFCHLEFAGMTVISVFLFLVIFRFYQKKRRSIVKIIVAIPLAYLMSGMFLYPYLKGEVASSASDGISKFFQSLRITLDPFYRITTSHEAVYFGLSLFIIAILGTLASNRISSPGFLTAFALVLMTALFAYPMLSLIPGSDILKMLQYLSIALALIFISVLYWEKLKKWVLIVFMVAIALDCLPSLKWIYGNENFLKPQIRLQKLSDDTFITEAQEICDQRIALFDLATLGSEGAFIISDFGKPTMSVFGSGWKYSVTHANTSRLNSAMCDEYFFYMFDRCIELGADTVIIQKDQAVYGEKTLVKLDKAAEQLGYDFIDENYDYMLYHLRVGEHYGTTAKYDAIGIGYSAFSLSLAFPNIKEAGDNYIDHYTYDYLSQFKTVYLSGFFYDNRQKAENLVLKLSENGVRIVILADGMPEDRETRSKTFLGVTCNVIQFENGYPILYTEDFGEMDCDLFPLGYSKWITYYLNGLGDVKGTISDNDIELAFFGTGKNENLCYIGLNIPFYYYLTLDSNAEKLMQWIMGMDAGLLPERHIYPLDITYNRNNIVINSDVDYINTGLAYHDNFRSDQSLFVDNNMLVVRKGQTTITFAYPYLGGGVLMTLIGIVLFVIYMTYLTRLQRQDKAQEIKEKEEKTYEAYRESAARLVISEIERAEEFIEESEPEEEYEEAESEPEEEYEEAEYEPEEEYDEYEEEPEYEPKVKYAEDPEYEPEVAYTEEPENQLKTVYAEAPEKQLKTVYAEEPEYEPEVVYAAAPEYKPEAEYAEEAEYEPDIIIGPEVVIELETDAESDAEHPETSVSTSSTDDIWGFDVPLDPGDDFDLFSSQKPRDG